MDHYVSEQEQIEQIKSWWKSNGRSLFAGLVLGLGGLAAYRYWDSTQLARAENASINYEMFLQMLADQRAEDAASAGRAIVEGYPGSVYARLSSLLLARLAVDNGDYEQAKQHLHNLIESKDSGEIAHIARARLARILLAEGELDEADKLMAAIPSRNEDTRFAELRGDLMAARGDLEGARTKYLEALVAADKLGIDREPIQLKLDNLGVAVTDNGS